MKPAPFDYVRAGSRAEAIASLNGHGDEARVLAGGQSLLAMMNMRIVSPELLIDISRAADLGAIRAVDGSVEIGASVTQSQLERWPSLGAELPLVANALPQLGHFQTRNKGTVCGSIAHADPSSELPLCLATLGGHAVLERRWGRRSVPAREFFTGLLQTARRPDELIVAVRFPAARKGEAFGFKEFALRHGDFAIIAAAARVTASSITLGIGGSAERPEVRDWPMLEGQALEDALNALAWELPMQDDVQADARYRRHLVRVLGRNAIMEACARLTPAFGDAESSPPHSVFLPASSPWRACISTLSRSQASAIGREDASNSLSPLGKGRSYFSLSSRGEGWGEGGLPVKIGEGWHKLGRRERHRIALTLNGQIRCGHAEPRMLLSDFLRHELGATGTHVGCEHGVCGACTVRLDGEAVRACLTLAVQADGRRVDTVEGLAGGLAGLSPLQEAFRRNHALQCGFCTAGILMSLDHFLEVKPQASEAEIRQMLSGHLCRCTGYTGIVQAALDLVKLRSTAEEHR